MSCLHLSGGAAAAAAAEASGAVRMAASPSVAACTTCSRAPPNCWYASSTHVQPATKERAAVVRVMFGCGRSTLCGRSRGCCHEVAQSLGTKRGRDAFPDAQTTLTDSLLP